MFPFLCYTICSVWLVCCVLSMYVHEGLNFSYRSWIVCTCSNSNEMTIIGGWAWASCWIIIVNRMESLICKYLNDHHQRMLQCIQLCTCVRNNVLTSLIPFPKLSSPFWEPIILLMSVSIVNKTWKFQCKAITEWQEWMKLYSGFVSILICFICKTLLFLVM